jgi:hypothetical protein
MLPGMIRGEPTWHDLRQYGVGWWIKSNETLRRLIEKVCSLTFPPKKTGRKTDYLSLICQSNESIYVKVAKTRFNAKQDPMDCSLFYMAMKKKTVLRGLFR